LFLGFAVLFTSCGDDSGRKGTGKKTPAAQAASEEPEPIHYLWQRTPSPKGPTPTQVTTAAPSVSPGPTVPETGSPEPAQTPTIPIPPENRIATAEAPRTEPTASREKRPSTASVQKPSPRSEPSATSGPVREKRPSPTENPTPQPAGSHDEPSPSVPGVGINVPAEGFTPNPSQPEGRVEDVDPPYVRGITMNPQESKAGATILIAIDAFDLVSGVKSVSGTIQSPSGNAIIPFVCHPDPQSGFFVSEIRIPDKAESGIWYIKGLTVTDTAGNQYHYAVGVEPILNVANFTVSSESSDNKPPALESLEFDPRSVKDGETVNVRIRAQDDISGIKGIFGTVKSPSGTATLSFSCKFSLEADCYMGTFKVPEKAEFGTWPLKYLRLVDNANNTAHIYPGHPGTENASFEVRSETSDSEAPRLNDILLVPKQVRAGGTVQVRVRAEDDLSGIRSIIGWVRNPSKTARIPFDCKFVEQTNDYVGQFTLPELAETGRWYIEILHLFDKAGNKRQYTFDKDPELSEAFAEVQ
jgi:hypothetical protein